jgi:hypothetical protein
MPLERCAMSARSYRYVIDGAVQHQQAKREAIVGCGWKRMEQLFSRDAFRTASNSFFKRWASSTFRAKAAGQKITTLGVATQW